jgi:NADH-quinone oxidoreductase subunit G
MVRIVIDGAPLDVAEGLTVLLAAEGAGIPIPHFCYHPAFVPEGSCRMCLVEIEGLPKLELACSTVVRDGMKVRTESPKVAEARRAVLEFLLAEHPLDCPICDKAGECKLQDYFEKYGLFEGQFKEPKERREKKYRLSRNLLLDRERCILCTRCVRFLSEITRTGDAGIVRRGVHSEVSVYESEVIDNNYAGNLAEICPVGAITDVDFRFKTRVWFLEKRESICPLCGRGCNIYIDSHPGFPRVSLPQRVYRIRARENADVNFSWICDIGRYGYAELDSGRQDRLLQKKGGRDSEWSWDKALIFLGEKIRGLQLSKKQGRIAAILHSGLTNEELFLAKKLFIDELRLENVFLADPPPGRGDDFLLTPERTPNKRGWTEIGLPASPPDLRTLAEKTDLLLIFGIPIASLFSQADLKGALERVAAKVLFASHKSGLDALADVIVPTPVVAEKSGTLTNVNGRVQSFVPALNFRGNGLPEGKILYELARELKLNHRYFWPLGSTESIFRALCAEIPFFK